MSFMLWNVSVLYWSSLCTGLVLLWEHVQSLLEILLRKAEYQMQGCAEQYGRICLGFVQPWELKQPDSWGMLSNTKSTSKFRYLKKNFCDCFISGFTEQVAGDPGQSWALLHPLHPLQCREGEAASELSCLLRSRAHPWNLCFCSGSSGSHWLFSAGPLQKEMLFDESLVLQQLRYTGMLETVRIRRSGYSAKYTFQVHGNWIVLSGISALFRKHILCGSSYKAHEHLGWAVKMHCSFERACMVKSHN